VRVLLDTCVLSDLRGAAPTPSVRQCFDSFREESLFLSVVTIGEIAQGVALLSEGKKKRGLLAWLETLEQQFQPRILPIDLETARIWGELSAALKLKGRTTGNGDTLIAATALRHGLHVMTRNVSDFEPTGALMINPWR
jgi:toxin FitB